MPAAAPNGITVLVAEDEPAVVRLPGAALPRHGFGAVLARGGEEAVAMARTSTTGPMVVDRDEVCQ